MPANDDDGGGGDLAVFQTERRQWPLILRRQPFPSLKPAPGGRQQVSAWSSPWSSPETIEPAVVAQNHSAAPLMLF